MFAFVQCMYRAVLRYCHAQVRPKRRQYGQGDEGYKPAPSCKSSYGQCLHMLPLLFPHLPQKTSITLYG